MVTHYEQCFIYADNTSCSKDEAPDNSILKPIAFASKSLAGAEKTIQQHRKRSPRHTIHTWKIPSLMLCKRGEHTYRSQTSGCNIQERCGNTITKTQQILLRLHQYRVRIIYKPGPDLFIADWLSRKKLQWKQICRNTQHVVKHQCNTNSYQDIRVHDNAWATTSNVSRSTAILS